MGGGREAGSLHPLQSSRREVGTSGKARGPVVGQWGLLLAFVFSVPKTEPRARRLPGNCSTQVEGITGLPGEPGLSGMIWRTSVLGGQVAVQKGGSFQISSQGAMWDVWRSLHCGERAGSTSGRGGVCGSWAGTGHCFSGFQCCYCRGCNLGPHGQCRASPEVLWEFAYNRGTKDPQPLSGHWWAVPRWQCKCRDGWGAQSFSHSAWLMCQCHLCISPTGPHV